MRNSSSPSQDVQRRQCRSNVMKLFIVGEAGQVNDHAAVGIAQRAQQLARLWRRLVATEHGHAGQALERAVVALGIDRTHAIAVQNVLFAEETRDPGFPGFRITSDQDVAAADREGEFSTVLQISEQQATATVSRHGEIAGCRNRSHVVGDGGRSGARNHDVGGRLQCCAAPGDSHTHFRQSQKLMVVFGVTDRNGISCREPQGLKRHLKAGRLAHALRCGHDTAAIEHEHERQFECANDIEQARRFCGVRIDQTLSSGEGNAAPEQFGAEGSQVQPALTPTSDRFQGNG